MAADQRPKPQYGEYADESATPETGSTEPLSGAPANGAAASGTAASGAAASDAPASSEASGLSSPAETAVPAHTAALSASAAPTAPATTGSAGANTPLPGVPHNLGVTRRPGAASPAGTTAGTAGSAAGLPTQLGGQHGSPYVAPPPPGAVQAPPAAPPTPTADTTQTVSSAAPQSAHQPAQAPAPPAPPAANQAAQPQPLEAQTRKRSPADRIITLILLGLGALGALNIAAGLYELPANLRMIGEMLGASELEVPDAVATAGVIGAISVLTLYALTLIYSIQRLRGGKLTFWVPLTAGVVATLINAGFLYFAVTQMPELFALLSDPAAFEALLGQAA